jgi:GDP-L-fucose synthase
MTDLAVPTPVLVTGATGMLGRNLLGSLRHLPTGAVLAPTRQDLDLCDADAVSRYWDRHRPQTVLHLAGFVRGILGNLRAGPRSLLLNARIQTNLLQAACDAPPQVAVVAGTVAAYGYPYVRLPLVEDDFWTGRPHEAEGFYAAGKRVAIPYLEALAQLGSGTRFAVLTNLFGPHDHFGEAGAHVVPSLIARFVDAAKAGADVVTVWGRPQTTRDFLHAADAAGFLLDLAVDAQLTRGFATVNVASGCETTMAELSALVAQASRFGGCVTWDADAPVGIPERSIDVARLRALSRRRPRPLADAVQTTVDWYVAHHR